MKIIKTNLAEFNSLYPDFSIEKLKKNNNKEKQKLIVRWDHSVIQFLGNLK